MWNTVVYDFTGKIKDASLIPRLTAFGNITLSEITASAVMAMDLPASGDATLSEFSSTAAALLPPYRQASGDAIQTEITASGIVPTMSVSQNIPPISIEVGGGAWLFNQYIDNPNDLTYTSTILNLNTNFATYDATPGSETLFAVADSGGPMAGLILEVTY